MRKPSKEKSEQGYLEIRKIKTYINHKNSFSL